jgi:hypothetical protein
MRRHLTLAALALTGCATPPGTPSTDETGLAPVSLLNVDCQDGDLLRYDAANDEWSCAAWPSAPAGLTESEVDAFVEDNGYALASSLAAVASSGEFSDLLNPPVDADTLAALGASCLDGQVPTWNTAFTAWTCATPATVSESQVDGYVANNGFARADEFSLIAWTGDYADLRNTPMDADTLSTLGPECADGGIPRWNSNNAAWMCSAPEGLAGVSETDVDAFVSNNGFALSWDLAHVALSGDYRDLSHTPTDADTLADLGTSCLDGQVPAWSATAGAWTCADPIGTIGLSEAEVDAYVSNNGYPLESELAAIARTGSFHDLVDVPPDADTLAVLGASCLDGQVPVWDSTFETWTCTSPAVAEALVDAHVANNGFALTRELADVALSGDFRDLANLPDDRDTLDDLGPSCHDGEVPTWTSALGGWACAAPGTGGEPSEALVDALVSDNGFALTSELASVATSGDFRDLLHVPPDRDTFASLGLTCEDGQVPTWTAQLNAWTCVDALPALTEGQVDAYVADNGYLRSAELPQVCVTGEFSDLLHVPPDEDSLAALSATCDDGQIPRWLASAQRWTCADLPPDTTLSESQVDAFVADNGFALSSSLATVATSGDYRDLRNAPPDADSLATLQTSCLNGGVPSWETITSSWTCAKRITETEVDAYVANNGFARTSALAAVATSGDYSDLRNLPADADSFSDLASECLDGQAPTYSDLIEGWECDWIGPTEEDVEDYITNGPIQLATGTTFAGPVALPAGSTIVGGEPDRPASVWLGTDWVVALQHDNTLRSEHFEFPVEPGVAEASFGDGVCLRYADGRVRCRATAQSTEASTQVKNSAFQGTYSRIMAARGATCVLSTDRIVTCVGSSSIATRATGALDFSASSYLSGCYVAQSDQAIRCWGADHPATPFVGTFSKVFTHESSGTYRVCGIRTDGSVACIGATAPSGTFRDLALNRDGRVCGITTSGGVRCHVNGNAPSDTMLPSGMISIEGGLDGFCAYNGTRHFCWGAELRRAVYP